MILGPEESRPKHFKEGSKIILLKNADEDDAGEYYICGYKRLRKGDILTVRKVEWDGEFNCYSFEEETCGDSPHFIRVEHNFKLANPIAALVRRVE